MTEDNLTIFCDSKGTSIILAHECRSQVEIHLLIDWLARAEAVLVSWEEIREFNARPVAAVGNVTPIKKGKDT